MTVRKLGSALALLAVLGVARSAVAGGATHVWSGAVNGNWSNAGNWSAGGAPANSEFDATLVFPFGMGNMGTMNNDVTGLDVLQWSFHDTAYAVTGNGITFHGIMSIDNGTANNPATVGINLSLTGAATFVVTGTPFDYWIDVTGMISGNQPVNVQIASGSGTPEVRFLGPNTYLGLTTVSSAYLVIDTPTGLGTTTNGTTVLPGGTLAVNNVTTPLEALSIGGSGQNGNGALQLTNATWQGPVTLTANVIFRSTGTGTISGLVSGGFGIDFSVSTFVLTQNNTYSGTSQISYGTVLVNGVQPSSAFVLAGFSTPSSTLGGSGTVGSVATGAGANPKVVDPGPAGGTGTLSTGNFSLNDTANGNHGVLHVDLNGTTVGSQYDRVAVTGTVDLTGAALQVSVGYVPVVSDTFTIVSNDGGDAVTGTFAGLAQGATFVAGGRTFQISYTGGDGNDVTLTVTSLTPVGLGGFTAE